MPSSNATITATYSGAGDEAGTGLRAQYYNDGGVSYPLANPFAGAPVLTRTDATVDFGWGEGSPGLAVTNNNFSAKWTGKVKAPVTGSYIFTVRGDDGVRLFINGTKVIDGWSDHGATDFTYATNLAAGTMSDVELHFYENAGGAECRLQWSYPGQGRQAIPQSQLFPPAGGYTLTVNGGSGDGTYAAGTQVTVSADAPPAGQQFVGWTGNTSILANSSAASTKATMPASNATITAAYSGTGSQTASYEAESGVLANGASAGNDSAASGGQYGGSMSNTNASITWNNVTGVGGVAVLTIRYGTHITNVVKGLYVNGVRVASVSLPATGAFTIYSTQSVKVTLNSGANTVAIVNDSASTGAVNIDKMDVQ